MFILFLPVLLMSLALIIDVGLMYNGKIKGEELLKQAKKENLDIEEYFKINDIEITELNTSRKNGDSCVIIKFKIDSVFGNLIGYTNYDIEVDDCK